MQLRHDQHRVVNLALRGFAREAQRDAIQNAAPMRTAVKCTDGVGCDSRDNDQTKQREMEREKTHVGNNLFDQRHVVVALGRSCKRSPLHDTAAGAC